MKIIITEDQHVSFNSRAWSEKLVNIIKKIGNKKIRIIGEKYPELYEKFPVDYFYINFGSLGVIEYDENKSGYDPNGKYCVYLIMGNQGIDSDMLDHELRHAYEDYMRLSKGKPSSKDDKEVKRYFSKDGYDLLTGKLGKFGIFNEIFYYLYLTTKIEENAYSENVYNNGIISSKLKIQLKMFLKLNINDFLEHRYQNSWNKLKQYDIPILNSFNDGDEFLKWSDKHIKYKITQILKKFNKIEYKSGLDKKGDS